MGFLQSLMSGANQGLIWALLALGVYITYRILDFADLTAEGSFALGGSVVAALIARNCEPVLATFIAFLCGSIAGLCTGLLHTKLKIPPILSGILTMIALYSINIRIMGSANVSLLRKTTVFTYIQSLGLSKLIATSIIGVFVVGAMIAALYWFMGTEFGSCIRATGSNPKMCRAQGINTHNTTIAALMISNAIIALSGSLVAQQQSYGDVTMGIGAIVIGLASVIIGEAFMGKKFPFWLKLVFVVVGSVIYRLIITLIILTNIFNASDVKMLTALIVIVALAIPRIKKATQNKPNKKNKSKKRKVNAQAQLEQNASIDSLLDKSIESSKEAANAQNR